MIIRLVYIEFICTAAAEFVSMLSPWIGIYVYKKKVLNQRFLQILLFPKILVKRLLVANIQNKTLSIKNFNS